MEDDEDDIEKWMDACCEADPVENAEFVDEEAGPPLSKDEIKQARKVLAEWHSPGAFRDAVHTLHKRCNSPDFFIRPDLKFLHDAFVIAEFTARQSVSQVRLAGPSDQWPDGYVRVGGKDHNVEVTSEHGGRKLGDEYRHVSAPTLDPVDNWVERGRKIPDALVKAIEAKVKKRYASPFWLVVYLNINEHGVRL